MKLSKFIEILVDLFKKHGDIEVFIDQEWQDPADHVNVYEEAMDDTFHEYWPKRVDISGGIYNHREEYKKRKNV